MKRNDFNKTAENSQDATEQTQTERHSIASCTSVAPPLVTPRTYEGSQYYNATDIGKMLGITRQAVSKWQNNLFMGAPIFQADIRTHDGMYLYDVERVMQLKAVYHKDWMRGGYQRHPDDILDTHQPTKNVAQVLHKNVAVIVPTEKKTVNGFKKLNAQIRPSKLRVELNDKQTKVIFKLTDERMDDLLNGETYEIVEKRDLKKGEIVTAYKILNEAGYSILRPFSQFDRAVLSVCVSEWLAGNHYTTPSIIYRGLTGKVNKGSDAEPKKDQFAAIIDSIQILMSRRIIFDASETCKTLNYNGGNPVQGDSVLLPSWYAKETKVNGQAPAITIFFNSPCPLLPMAQAKNQLLTYDSSLLDMPGQQNTKMTIELKNYCMIRVQEIIAHKQLHPTLTFKDIFQKCRLDNADSKTKLRAREFVIKFFDHLKNQNVIKSFEVNWTGKSMKSISFSFAKPKK